MTRKSIALLALEEACQNRQKFEVLQKDSLDKFINAIYDKEEKEVIEFLIKFAMRSENSDREIYLRHLENKFSLKDKPKLGQRFIRNIERDIIFIEEIKEYPLPRNNNIAILYYFLFKSNFSENKKLGMNLIEDVGIKKEEPERLILTTNFDALQFILNNPDTSI